MIRSAVPDTSTPTALGSGSTRAGLAAGVLTRSDFFGDATNSHAWKRLPEFSAVWAYTPSVVFTSPALVLASSRTVHCITPAALVVRHRPGRSRHDWQGACPKFLTLPATLPVVQCAVATAAIAAAVDYGATPRRFTPGWEFMLSKRAMAVAYGAMAAGLAAGALLTQHRDR